jgi:hypothetical protein
MPGIDFRELPGLVSMAEVLTLLGFEAGGAGLDVRRAEVVMLRCFLWVGLLAVLTACPFRALDAEGEKSWQEAEVKKLGGRWTTVREEKIAKEKVRRRRVDLEFADGKLTVFLFNEKDAQIFDDHLKVIGVEEVKGLGLGSIARLKLGGNESQKAEVYYDFVGEKLILIGRIGWRPWEGFPLSGEYKRAEKPK